MDIFNLIDMALESYRTGDLVRDLCKKFIEHYDESINGEFDIFEFEKFSTFLNHDFSLLFFTENLKEYFDYIDSDKNGKIDPCGKNLFIKINCNASFIFSYYSVRDREIYQ